MPTRYVNTASTAGTQDGTTNTAGNSGTAAFASLSAAIAAIPADITTGGGQGVWTILCCGTTADATAVTISGITTSSTYYIEIKGNPDDAAGAHAGIWSESKYRLAVSDAVCLILSTRYVRINGLQIRVTDTTAHWRACVQASGVSAGGSDIRLSNLILRRHENANYVAPGVLWNDADAGGIIWNTIVYGTNANTGHETSGLHAMDTSGLAVYGCTFAGGYHGINAGVNMTITAKNCYGSATSTVFRADTGATLTLTNCASSDTSAGSSNGCLSSVLFDTTEGSGHAGFESTDPANSAYLKLKSGSYLVGKGATLTDDPPGSTALGVDIAGNTRS